MDARDEFKKLTKIPEFEECVEDKELLVDYLQAAVAFGRDYLSKLDLTTLDEIIDESWEPPVTRAVRIISTLDDASMHSGQAVYTRRLVLGR